MGFASLFLFLGAGWGLFGLRRYKASLVFVLLAVAAAGAARTSVAERSYRTNALHNYEAPEYIDVTGVLTASPGREPDKDVLLVRVVSLRDRGKENRAPGILRLAVPFSADGRGRLRLRAGDAIRASVRFSSGQGFRNFGGFSYERHLRNQGIHRRASTKSSLLVSRLEGGSRGWGRRFAGFMSRIRCGLQEVLEARFPGTAGGDISSEGAVLEALLLGEDGRMDQPTVLSLQQTGLYHLFAISGGHIAIISVLLFSLLRMARVPQRASQLVLIVFLVFYTFLVEGSPSVLRAVVMALALLVGRLLWKDVSILNTISFSAFVLLLANPFSLFDAGFQLTYAATLAIILFCPPLVKRLPRLPFGLSEMTAMSAAAILGVMPIIAGNFNRVTFASFLLNYAAIPLVGVIMGAGYFFLPVAAMWPMAGSRLAVPLKLLVGVFAKLSHLLDGASVLSYRVPTPHRWTVIGYYLFLALVIVRPRFKGQRLGAGLGLMVFMGILVTYPFPSTSANLKVTMLDVGQGDALLVEFAGRAKMLVDGGGLTGSPFDLGERVVSPALWAKGIKRIDVLVLTHPHPDHLNGLVAVARNFKIGEFWEGSPPQDDQSGTYKALCAALPRGTARKRMSDGFRYTAGQASVSAVHPSGTAGPVSDLAANDGSVVLRVEMGETAFLLTGDIGAAAESEILASGRTIKSAVLKVAHHGSGTSSSEAFLDRVGPSIALISVGEGNRYGFPTASVLERCGQVGSRVFRTDLDGAIEVSWDGRNLLVRTAVGNEKAGGRAATSPRPGAAR